MSIVPNKTKLCKCQSEICSLRGEESIRWLGERGVTFTLRYGHDTDAMPKGWNKPGAGHATEEAIAHFKRNNGIGALAEHVVIPDIDYNFREQCAKLGDLGHTAKLGRDNAPDRGALIYRVVDGPVQSADWRPEGPDTPPHAELKAQTKTGNYLQKNVAGRHKGGEYILFDTHYGIREITRADLALIWILITGEELHAPKPAKPVKIQRDNYHVDSDDFKAKVKAYWTPFRVFEYHGWVRNGTEEEGGEIRILGHGGLLCDEKKGVWNNRSEDVGGDSIDAWAKCTNRFTSRDQYFVDIITEMANAAGIEVPRFRPQEPAPLPEGAKVLDNGTVILKTTPTPEPKPVTIPVLTPSVVAKLAQALRGPLAIELINRLGRIRDRESWRDVLIQLVTKIAPSQNGWVIDAGQDWLGEQFGISGVAARKKMYTMDSAGLIRYLHTGHTSKSGRPMMRVDLQPLIAALWESCAKLENSDSTYTREFSNFNDDPPVNVHAVYSGTGQYADASMRTLYKFAIRRSGHPTVLARSITKSALTAMDYFVRHGEGTRAELVEGTGMTAGAAAGATRCLAQLGLVTVEWDGPGTPKIYVLRQDWEAHLQATIPHMTSYGARTRLVIRNYDRWIAGIERTLKSTFAPQMIHSLKDRKRKLESARKKWCDYGRKTGAYGRYVQEAA